MKRDKDGNITWDDEEEGQIEMLSEAKRRAAKKIRADVKAEQEAEEAAKKPCSICGKPSGEGEHGDGKCKKQSEKKKFSILKGA